MRNVKNVGMCLKRLERGRNIALLNVDGTLGTKEIRE